MKKRIGFHDVIEWLDSVGNEDTLNELKVLVEARILRLKYFEEDTFPV